MHKGLEWESRLRGARLFISEAEQAEEGLVWGTAGQTRSQPWKKGSEVSREESRNDSSELTFLCFLHFFISHCHQTCHIYLFHLGERDEEKVKRNVRIYSLAWENFGKKGLGQQKSTGDYFSEERGLECLWLERQFFLFL